MSASPPYDAQTIAFYNREAGAYAESRFAPSPALDGFVARVGSGAKVLELGCGGGHEAAVMLAAGIDVFATDASAEMAACASARLGRPVKVMRFDELEADAVFDGAWANACLLHVPAEALPETLQRIRRALKPAGLFFASFKAGEGGDRDSLGRYFNFPNRAALERAYRASGPWSELVIEEGEGGGYDGIVRKWLSCSAVRG